MIIQKTCGSGSKEMTGADRGLRNGNERIEAATEERCFASASQEEEAQKPPDTRRRTEKRQVPCGPAGTC